MYGRADCKMATMRAPPMARARVAAWLTRPGQYPSNWCTYGINVRLMVPWPGMGAVMTNRLARFHVNPLYVWVVPALAGAAITAYLCWGAWVTAHDPRWLTLSHAWWRSGLAPRNDLALLVAVLVGLTAWTAFWWPRRVQGRFTGLIAVVTMVAVGAALGTSALAPCRGGETGTSVAAGSARPVHAGTRRPRTAEQYLSRAAAPGLATRARSSAWGRR